MPDHLAVLVPVPAEPVLPVAADDSQVPPREAFVYILVQTYYSLLLPSLSALAAVLGIVAASCLFCELLLPWLLAFVEFARGLARLAVAFERPLYQITSDYLGARSRKKGRGKIAVVRIGTDILTVAGRSCGHSKKTRLNAATFLTRD